MAFEVEILAGNLKHFRKKKGLTQQALAERLLISPQSVSKWERGQSVPELDKLCALADILNVSVDALLEGQNNRSKVFVGVDGGGTKTEFVLFGEDGELLRRLVEKGSNPNLHGLEDSALTFQTGLKQLLQPGMRLAGLHIGCAGFPTGGYGEKIRARLQEEYPQAKITCSSDFMNIVASGSSPDRCVAAICGTGSVVYANEHRTLYRHGGGGYLLDIQGSGFDMGRDVLRTALQERDGVGPGSLITALTEQRLGSTVWEAVSDIYKQGTAYIASFAPIAFEAYRQGDPVAEQILRGHGAYLANLIQTAVDHHDCGKAVVLSGSIFTHNPDFLQMLQEHLAEDIQLEVPGNPPVYGACVLALENCGIGPEVLQQFGAQYGTFLEE